jgi:hypothetical protein
VINNNIGLPNSYLFVGNSVFDPDFSGTGSQPLGFDQLAGLYSRYRVLGSTITVDMMTPSAGTNQSASINAVVCATNQSTGFTQVDPAAAQPVAVRRVFWGVNPAGPKGGRFVLTAMTSDMHGIPASGVLVDDELSATTAANPAQLWYWQIVTEAVDRATTTSVTCEVTIDYLVDFYEFVQGNLSSEDSLSNSFLREMLRIRSKQGANVVDTYPEFDDLLSVREYLKSKLGIIDPGDDVSSPKEASRRGLKAASADKR